MAEAVKAGGLAAYVADARSFDQDRVLAAYRSRRLAWSVAGVASVLACCGALGVAALAPFKTVVPLVFRVDNATGIVETVSTVTETANTQADVVTKYFAGAYVRAREGYVASEAKLNFKAVALMSAQPEQLRLEAANRLSNPDAPQNVYGKSATSKISIKSISLLTKDVVSVRYSRKVSRGEADERVSHWVATLTFAYVPGTMDDADRLINPLGFVVSEYHADPENVQ
jgi:type IV secretion system protein VirB8